MNNILTNLRRVLREGRTLYGHKVTSLSMLFNTIDHNNDLTISLLELGKALKRLDLGVHSSQIEMLLTPMVTIRF